VPQAGLRTTAHRWLPGNRNGTDRGLCVRERYGGATVTDAVAAPNGDWWRRAATWLAHQQPVVIASGFAVFLYDAAATSPVTAALSITAMIVVIASTFAEGYHQVSLCPRCARSIPLDGSEQAARRSDWLRLHHRLEGAWWSILLIVGAIGVVVTLGVPPGIALAPVYVSWVVEAVANLRHRLLQLWCPQCRWWDDDGDDETPVVPVPPSVKASR
jgi:hypothetical protein